MAYGLGVPVVATRTGDLATTIKDGITGFLVDAGDVDALVRAIVRFFRENRTEEFRAAIKQAQDRFGWDTVITTLLQPIESERKNAIA
jgi:glycosyltransferase involved in cell wall biosynthesis